MCQNMNVLLGVTRRLTVGLSDVAGWGCFVMEDIKDGEYIVRAAQHPNLHSFEFAAVLLHVQPWKPDFQFCWIGISERHQNTTVNSVLRST